MASPSFIFWKRFILEYGIFRLVPKWYFPCTRTHKYINVDRCVRVNLPGNSFSLDLNKKNHKITYANNAYSDYVAM